MMPERSQTNFIRRVIASLIFLTGCASSHNLKTDGHNPLGGGFADQEILIGFHHLSATANMSPWPSYGAAIATWRKRAEQLCGASPYQEIIETTGEGFQGTIPTYIHPGAMLDLPKYNTSISGYVLCSNAEMTYAEAVAYLRNLELEKAQEFVSSRRRELAELGGGECHASDKATPPETLYRRGKILSAMDDYKSAMTCFLAAQEQEQGTVVHRNSCSEIGTMYELGWGVPKDISTAMLWYKKAGL